MKKIKFNRYNGQEWESLDISSDWESINNKPTNYPPTAHTHNYLPKTTYEYNKELALSSTGKVCIGKFSMYDSNVTVEISSATNTTYNGTLVIATQNIDDSHGGSYVANVYGDATGTLSSRLVVIYPTNSRIFEIYCDFPTYSKNLVHIKALGLTAEPTNILTTVSSIPTTNTISVNNLLTQKLDLKANKSDITSVYKARGSISDVSTIDATMPDGYVYNVTVDFTTNENFVEDNGKTYPAGTNIVKVTVNGSPKWDVLSGMVDLSSYAKASDLANKVDKVSGKGLSTNDYTTAEKTKLANLPTAENLSSWEEGVNDKLDNKLDKSGTAYSVEKATATKLGGIQLGYDTTELKYPVALDDENKAHVNITSMMKNNCLAFLPPECIIIEKSIDGGNTWSESDLSDESKTLFFTKGEVIRFLMTPDNKVTCNSMIRITITGMKYNVPEGTIETEKYNYWNSNNILSQRFYADITETEIKFSSTRNRISCYIEGATGVNPNNWVYLEQRNKLNGWPGTAYMKFNEKFGSLIDGTTYCNWRFTFRIQGIDGTYDDSKLDQNGYIPSVEHIYLYSDNDMYYSYNNMSKTGHLYDYDVYQNAIFPARIESKGALFSGRVYGTGDDEGVVIEPSINGNAALCLGEPSGVRSVLYNTNGRALWRNVTSDGSTYDLYHPNKAGTIATIDDMKKALHSEVLYDGEINFERGSTTFQTITVAATQSSYKFFVFTGYDGYANAVSFLGSAYGYSTIVVPIELSNLRWEYNQYQTKMTIYPTENSSQFTLLKIIGVY